ncbi:LOW QUALITY PROTEIN: hypothetical protein MXB_4479 [Myxobolus squamalis]|nr:LOW QUALITY PROTEIN: hypothetical protein MXB_4479 [Myxobolus squamalis]
MKEETTDTAKRSIDNESNHNEKKLCELHDPLLKQVARQASKNLQKYRVLRFMVMAAIILTALFLLTYSGYLIAVQYLLNVAKKYNMKLLNEDKIFFEFDVQTFSFNSSCSHKTQSIDCIIANLYRFKENGVTDIILKSTFDDKYELNSRFSDKKSLKKLIEKAEFLQIGIYLDIEKQIRGLVTKKEEKNDDSASYRKAEISFIITDNNTCIDTYKQDVMAIVETFASMGIEGFIINDLPCCAIFPEYFHNDQKAAIFQAYMNYERLQEKKENQVQSPKAMIYNHLIEILSEYNYTFFDAIINYIKVDYNESIEIPTLRELKPEAFPHVIWTIDSAKMMNISTKTYLFNGIVAFFSGSAVQKASNSVYGIILSIKNKASEKSRNSEYKYDNYIKALEQASFLSDMKESLKNVSCVSDSPSYIPEYSSNGIFLAVMRLNDKNATHCVLVINFGEIETSINMKAHFQQSETKIVKAIHLLTINSSGLVENNSKFSKHTFVLEPKIGIILRIIRDD